MNLGIENELLEFKKSPSELNEAIIDITAMLNKHGKGTLYFGVRNNGDICGMDISESTTRDVSRKIYEQIKPQIYPTIEIMQIEDKNVIKVCFNGNQKPYSADGRYYNRVADESRKVTPSELTEMILSANYTNWEKQASDNTIDDIDENQLQLFHAKSISSGRLPYMQYDKVELLSRLHLIADDGIHLNNAGKLLFSNKNPITIKLAVFATNEKQTFIDINPIKGNIFILIEECEKYIKKHMNWEAKIVNFERIETPEIPLDALREILINSFAHANYLSLSKHEIDIHPSKIAIYNPGSFPDGYTPEDFVNKNLSSKVRNELICEVLFKCNAVETWGTGFRKTYTLCNKNAIKLYYEKEYDGFWFYFLRKFPLVIKSTTANYITNDNSPILSELENLVLDEIKGNPCITRASLSKIAYRNVRTIQRILDSLKKKNIIERVGSNKTGHWIVKI